MLGTCKSNATSVLASFAILKSLSDEKKYQSSYQILREFIRYIITSDSLYSFTAVEMKTLLTEYFDFSIPEAVIKTALKHMDGITLDHQIYSAAIEEIAANSIFEIKKKEADDYASNTIRLLSEYISEKTDNAPIKESKLIQELANFLIDGLPSSSSQYTDFIGEFLLKKENDKTFQAGLDKICEGSILYMGLSHNIGETGSIAKPLSLYLSTEILFSLMGYNGEIYQQFANDFYDQIRLANAGGKNKITLYYFAETEQEIDEFFGAAKEIVNGKKSNLLDKPAMKKITDGCSTSSDVAIKQSDFFYKLQHSFGIKKDPCRNYYDEIMFSSTLDYFEYDDEDDKKKKKDMALKFISHINKLRKGNRYQNDIDSEYLIVTNTKATLEISKEQSEILRNEEGLETISNFAVSLDRITSLLWYKLGNGFSEKEFPKSISAILKARIVLSSKIARNAKQEYVKAQTQYKEGQLTEEQATARIIMLRNKPLLPEELQRDNIDEIMDFSPEYLSRYEEQYKNTQKALEEKETLIEAMRNDTSKQISEKDAQIASQKSIIKNKDAENNKLRNELESYHREKEALMAKKENRKNRWKFVWSIVWKILILVGASAIAITINKYCSKTLGIISFVIDFFGLLYALWTVFKKDKAKYLSKHEDSNTNQK